MLARLALLPVTVVIVGFMTTRPPVATPVSMPAVVVNRAPFPEKGDLYVFLDAMAFRESNNNPSVVNRYGDMGKYQFGDNTLQGLGEQFQVTRDEFLGNTQLQDSAMVEYLRQNRDALQDIIVQYDGKWYRGMYITESGILAGAHLVGPQGVKAFFNPHFWLTLDDGTRKRPRIADGNGTSVQTYIREFSGYTLTQLN